MNAGDLILNSVLVVSALTWLFTEVTKYITGRLTGRSVGMFESGGMPSAHAATISAATTVIALDQGLASPLFGFAVIVAGVVLHDSCRVRLMAGETAGRVNALSKGKHPITVHRGHTLLEVAVGTAFGIALALILYHWLYA